jgi:glutathione S-transferase
MHTHNTPHTNTLVCVTQVPVVRLDDEVVVDSTAIISRLAAEVEAGSSSSSSRPAGRKSGW